MKFYTRLDRPSRIYWSAAFETAPLYRRRKSARIDRSLSQTTLLWWRINATVYIYIYIFRFVYNRREKIRRRSGGRRITSVCVGTWSKLTSLAIRRGRNQIVCSSRLIKKWRSSNYTSGAGCWGTRVVTCGPILPRLLLAPPASVAIRLASRVRPRAIFD